MGSFRAGQDGAGIPHAGSLQRLGRPTLRSGGHSVPMKSPHQTAAVRQLGASRVENSPGPEPGPAGSSSRAWSRRTMRQAFLAPDTLQHEAVVFLVSEMRMYQRMVAHIL